MSELTYTKQGDYLIPDVAIKESPPLGKYGMLRKSYLKQHRKGLYTSLLLQEELYPHCLEIEQTANERLERMMPEMLVKDPPPDKATDPLGWAAHMNMTQAQAEEVIYAELIYS